LLLGIVASTWQAIRATRAEREQSRLRQAAQQAEAKQVQLRQQADEARARSQANEQKAETEAARSEQVARFMKDMLKGVGPSVAAGRDTTMLREILDKTAERVGKELTNQPEVEAELRATMGATYLELSQLAEAEAMEREALRLRKSLYGETNLLVAASLYDVARVVARSGQVANLTEAETLVRQALALRRARWGDEHPEVADSIALLAGVLQRRGKLTEAEAFSREALAARRKLLGTEHKDVASSLDNLALVLMRQGKRSEAETLVREALAIQRKVLGNDAGDVAFSLRYLADALQGQGKLAEAETALREALAINRKLYGEEHPNTVSVFSRLSAFLREQGKTGELEIFLREQMEASLRKTEHGGQANDWLQRARLHGELGDRKAALDAYEKALALITTEDAAVKTAPTLMAWGAAGLKNGESEIAEKAYRLAARIYDKAIVTTPNQYNYRNRLSSCYQGTWQALEAGKTFEEAVEFMRKAIAVLDRALADLPEQRQAFLMQQGHNHRYLAFRLWGQRKYQEARTGFEKASPCFLEFAEEAEPPAKAGALQGHALNLSDVAQLWEREGRTNEARAAYLQSLAVLEQIQTQGLAPLIVADWRIDHYNYLADLLEKFGTPEDASRIATVFCTPEGKLDMATLLSIASSRLQLGTLLRKGQQAEESNRQFEKARATLAEAVKSVASPDGKVQDSDDANRLHGVLSTIATGLLAQNMFAEAEPLARECLKLRETLISDDWRTFNARSLLGGALLGQKKYAEAEPLLVSGYDGMKQREARIPVSARPQRLKEAQQRLVRLYEETNRPDQAAEWKQKLSEFDRPQK
jgi:tetratricopeptide (TPR) repeat protein